MHVLENIKIEKIYNSKDISPKLEGLKWISRYNVLSNGEEIRKVQRIKEVLEKERGKIMFFSNYNFFSSILNKPLNSPNRWYGSNVSILLKIINIIMTT